MHFANPEYLNLLWGIPALGVFFAWAFRRRRKRVESLIGASLASRLTDEFSYAKAVLRTLFLLGFFLFGILAIARPQWGTRLETVHRRGVDIIVGLDTSYSMNTEDVAPNRLQKAKGEIRRLLQRSEGDRIGLVSFAGTAMVQCPLTLDHGAIELFLDIAEAGMVPEPGTSLASAIETATSAFIAEERKYKVLVLFTDGEDLEGQVDKAIRKAKDAGVIIYSVGIGTPQGKPIPVRDSKGEVLEYRKDPDGRIVISSLDERSLARIADETGGRYFRATTSENEIETLYKDIAGLEKKELESQLFQNFEDRFQYPLALAILFLAAESWISEKRKPGTTWLGRLNKNRQPTAGRPLPLFAAAVILIASSGLKAESLASKNKEGNRLFAQGKYEDAEKAYLDAQVKNPGRAEILYNLGNALIKQNKYDQGIQSLHQSIDKGDRETKENSWYNAGNAYFAMDRFKDSAEAYVQALKLDPADRDAKHNLEMALMKLKQQQKQSGSNQKQKDSQKSAPEQSSSGKNNRQQESKQSAQGDSASPKKQNGTSKQEAPQEVRREGTITREQAAQILDAVQNQELEQQRKLLESRARRKSGGKDW